MAFQSFGNERKNIHELKLAFSFVFFKSMSTICITFLYTHSWKTETLSNNLVAYSRDTWMIPNLIVSFKSGWRMGSVKAISLHAGILKRYTAIEQDWLNSSMFVLLTTVFIFRGFDLIWQIGFYCFPEWLTMKQIFFV